jgi:hypothetical protein
MGALSLRSPLYKRCTRRSTSSAFDVDPRRTNALDPRHTRDQAGHISEATWGRHMDVGASHDWGITRLGHHTTATPCEAPSLDGVGTGLEACLAASRARAALATLARAPAACSAEASKATGTASGATLYALVFSPFLASSGPGLFWSRPPARGRRPGRVVVIEAWS